MLPGPLFYQGHCQRGEVVTIDPRLTCGEEDFVVSVTVIAPGNVEDYSEDTITAYNAQVDFAALRCASLHLAACRYI